MCRERSFDYFVKAKLESEQKHEQEHKEVCTKIKSSQKSNNSVAYFQLFNWEHLIRTIVHFTDSFRTHLVFGPCDDARTYLRAKLVLLFFVEGLRTLRKDKKRYASLAASLRSISRAC